MTQLLSNVYVQTFEQNVRTLAQQGDTLLRRFVTSVSKQSERHNWERIAGADDVAEKTVARVATPQNDHDWSRRSTLLKTYHDGDTVEQEDIVQMLVDPNSAITQALAMGMKRKVDDIIIAAATGTALDGDDNAVIFPEGTVSATNPKGLDQTINSATAPISLDAILAVQEKFAQEEVDVDMPKCMIVGPTQQRKLMQLLEVTSADFQSQKALATGYLPNFMGFTWIVSNRLLAPTGTTLSCLAFTARGLGLHLGRDITARVQERVDQSFNWQFYTYMTMACVRTEDEHVVELLVKDAMT